MATLCLFRAFSVRTKKIRNQNTHRVEFLDSNPASPASPSDFISNFLSIVREKIGCERRFVFLQAPH